MARIDSFLKKWASVPSQFERPTDALIDRGWAGGAAEDPPEAKWENWWHNRVDEALAEIESNGALQWFDDVPYSVGATVRQGGKNWIAAIANSGIDPVSGDNVEHWFELGVKATEALLGRLRVGTQAEVNAGGLDDVIVTPQKLRLGFSFTGTAAVGAVRFPDWLGKIQFVWGGTSGSNGESITFALGFSSPPRIANMNVYTSTSPATTYATGYSTLSETGFTTVTNGVSFSFIAIGIGV